ncbi:hypothetical protein BBUWI9123_F0013 (plasmid) [Borreliella burgdorferi WI91-23]|nr:hypothetical protein BBUWI9123_F0013 [Borreliella burgdorferi WI91-23]
MSFIFLYQIIRFIYFRINYPSQFFIHMLINTFIFILKFTH